MSNGLTTRSNRPLTTRDFFDRFFEDAFGRGVSPLGFSGAEATGRDWVPSVDITERDGTLLVSAEIPGLKKEDVDVDISNGVLTLSGKREFEHDETKDNVHRIERSYGSFRRSFTLPSDADASKASAEFTDGVLRVSIPKTEAAKATKVSIK